MFERTYLTVELHDHKQKVHRTMRLIQFNKFWSLQNFKEECERLFAIPVQLQVVIDKNGEDISCRTENLSDLGVADGDKLILKHFHLDMYVNYSELLEAELSDKDDRIRIAQEASRMHQILSESKFFIVYLGFRNYDKLSKLQSNNEDLNNLKKATERYFWTQHVLKKGNDSENGFHVRFAEPDYYYSCKNFLYHLCYAALHMEQVKKFTIERIFDRKAASLYSFRNPLLPRLFLHKLFEILGIGSRTQFIHPSRSIGTGIEFYLASEWPDEFVSLEECYKDNETAMVELLLLEKLFAVDSLTSESCGIWKQTGKIAIINFQVCDEFELVGVFKRFLMAECGNCWNHNLGHIFLDKKIDSDRKISIAVEALKRWNLLSNIEMAEAAVEREMPRLKEWFDNSDSFELYDDYILTIKEYVKVMLDELETRKNVVNEN